MTINNLIKLSRWVKTSFVTPDEWSHWFGYYNYSPLDAGGRRLLAHRVNFDGREITAGDTAEVGWFDMEDRSWHTLGRTRAFNWQQGAMLQWLGPDFGTRVIYNDVKEGRFVARIVDLAGRETGCIPWPVYGVTPDGKTSISLQFERSYWCRAYHYESVKNPVWNVPRPADDGVFSVDLESGDTQRIIALDDIVRYEEPLGSANASHWFEHIMLNPSGTRFAVYHRFGQGDNFQTRAFTSDLHGQDLYLCPEWRDGIASHLGWINENDFVIFTYKKAPAGQAYAAMCKRKSLSAVVGLYRQFIKPFVSERVRCSVAANTCYLRYRDRYGVTKKYSAGMLLMDGHPSFTHDGRFMLTDTYADEAGYRHLLLYDTTQDQVFELGCFYSPFNCCGYRSDLHPRFSREQTSVIIDTAHSGRHQMMVLDLDWEALLGG